MKRILFIGNSFTYVNDLPATLADIAGRAGFPLEVHKVVKGGWYLSRYANPEDEMGRLLREEYPKQEWDYIVLQDQSLNPAANPEEFRAAAKALCGMMRCKESFVFYQTWAYTDGSEKLRSTGLSYQEMQEKLQSSYRQAAQENHALLAPVGDAFRRCYELYPDLATISGDQYHPSPCGTYLAACVFFAVLSGQSPLCLPVPLDMDVSWFEKKFQVTIPHTIAEKDGAILRQIAHDVTLAP